MRSLSEIETTAKRATRAAGYSWGVGEEVGKAIRILEIFGFAGIINLDQYFKVKKKIKFENFDYFKSHNQPKKDPYCPIMFGISFLDQIRDIEKLNKISVNNIGFPFLVLPFLSRSSEIIGKKIQYKFDEYEFNLNLNLNISFKNFFRSKIT